MARMISIEVGCSTTKIVEMDYQAKRPKVYRCLETKTPEGAVIDGYLQPEKMDLLKEAIKERLKTYRIMTKRVLFTVFSGKIICREVILPGVKVHQIGAIVESNLSEYFPIELEGYKIAHLLINTFNEGENAGKHKVLVMAAEQALLKGYEKLAEELGLYIVDIDYAGNSALQAARHSAGTDAIMAIKAEDENALITIIKQGTMMMQRSVNYNMGRMDAEPPTDDDKKRILTGTVSRVMDFYLSNNEENKIDQIYIMGEATRDFVIADVMHEQTNLPCRVLDNVRGAALTRTAEESHINLFAAAIGAGISSVGFDKEKEQERHETNYVSACVLIILFFVAIAATLVTLSMVPYSVAVAERQSLEAKQQQYSQAKEVYDRYIGIKQLYDQVAYGNALTEHSNDGILDFLAELEEKMPADVEITEFASNDDECIMAMSVADKETAAGVINALRGFESLMSVSVKSITEQEPDEGSDEQAVPDAAEAEQEAVENQEESVGDGEAAAVDTQEQTEEISDKKIINTTILFTVNCVYYPKDYMPPAEAVQETPVQSTDSDM